MLQVGDILPIDEVLTQAAQSTSRYFEIRGQQLPKNDTLKVILLHGTACVCCGRKAVYFQYVNMDRKGGTDLKLHLYFDHKESNGTQVRMTKDHIVPRSKGGPNTMENYQPMCYTCNNKKGSKVDLKVIPEHLKGFISTEPNVKNKTKPQPPTSLIITDYDLMIYVGYIRWYTQVFHPNASLKNWNTSVKTIIRNECFKVHPNVDRNLFERAYQMLYKQVLKYHDGCPAKELKIRPSTFFNKYY